MAKPWLWSTVLRWLLIVAIATLPWSSWPWWMDAMVLLGQGVLVIVAYRQEEHDG